MNRRRFVKVFGGFALAGIPASVPGQRQDRIIVAGGGILGASIAYHLASRGARVVMLDRTGPAAGATANSFAWLNAGPGKTPWHYHLLNRLGLQGWAQLEAEWGGELEVQWGGHVQWHPDDAGAARLRQDVEHHQRWGYAGHMVDEAALHALEGQLTPGPVAAAAHWKQEGNVDPVHAAEVFVRRARQLGAEIVFPCEVTGVQMRSGRLRSVQTTCGEREADVLVIACGVDTPRVAALTGLQVPLVDAPGLLAHTTPTTRLIQRVIAAPGAHFKQKADGRIVVGTSFEGAPVVDASRQMGQRILAAAKPFLPQLADSDLERVTVGWRPLPEDGHPIIGFADNQRSIYPVVMHSGMTLAPLIGRLAAVEILDGVRVDLLRHYRLSRFG